LPNDGIEIGAIYTKLFTYNLLGCCGCHFVKRLTFIRRRRTF
jgi:hypothetical protein